MTLIKETLLLKCGISRAKLVQSKIADTSGWISKKLDA